MPKSLINFLRADPEAFYRRGVTLINNRLKQIHSDRNGGNDETTRKVLDFKREWKKLYETVKK